jgi:hypothetical protein
MPYQLLGFLSCLAYLTLCLLIAASGTEKYLRGSRITEDGYNDPMDASTIGQFAGEGGRRPLPSLSPRASLLLSMSCLVSLFSFLFLPCGTLPSLLPVSGSALFAMGGLALALGFRGISGGWGVVRRQWEVPLCLGVSLAVIARYAQQRGVPGDLHTLDAYVAMPIIGAAEGVGKLGVGFLAVASLLAVWNALPARRVPASEGEPPGAGETLFVALASELWGLAAIGFWIGLFFPLSFAYSQDSEISSLAGLALNALFFWGKVLGLKYLLEKRRENFTRNAPFPMWILAALLVPGACLLLGAAAE